MQAPPPANAITVLVNDAPKPAGKGRRFMQLAEVDEGLQGGFLRRVLGQVLIPELGARVAHRHVLEAGDDLAVGLPVSLLNSRDQCCQVMYSKASASIPKGPFLSLRSLRTGQLFLSRAVQILQKAVASTSLAVPSLHRKEGRWQGKSW